MKTVIRVIWVIVLLLPGLAGQAQSQSSGEDAGSMPVLFLQLEELTEATAVSDAPEVLFLEFSSWVTESGSGGAGDPVAVLDDPNTLFLELRASLEDFDAGIPDDPTGDPAEPSPVLLLAFEGLSAPLSPEQFPTDQPHTLLVELWPQPENALPDDPSALLLALDVPSTEAIDLLSVVSTELLVELRHVSDGELFWKIAELLQDWQDGLFPPWDDWGGDDEPGPIAAIPEPSTLVLFGLGLVGGLALAWRRGRRL
jgi:hypothetical protein